MRIDQKIAEWKGEKPFFSFEFFPPKTDIGLMNLYGRMERFAESNPMWIDVTWGAGGSTSDKTIEICENAINYFALDPLMHLTCTNMAKDKLDQIIDQCREKGIKNILALRGDPPEHEEWSAGDSGFHRAVDLVRYIRAKHGDYFCIAVAGYPEGHLENPSFEDDMMRLKEKVDAGANIIVTQLFYVAEKFVSFVEKAHKLGIVVPIIPGIMPIQSYAGFKKMTALCKTAVPDELAKELENYKNDEQAVKTFGVSQCVEMCESLLASGTTPGLHFYTLNLEVSVFKILENLFLLNDIQRDYPWRTLGGRRAQENIRPIFWSNRPMSYVTRTSTWDDFPNGRWGLKDSPAYGDITFSISKNPDEQKKSNKLTMWEESLQSSSDVKKVFCKYIRGQICKLPWSSDKLTDEACVITKQLLALNASGLLTINSQPRVNGALSSDPIFGWGPRNGYVYQKAYIEFFCDPHLFEIILPKIEMETDFTYSAVQSSGRYHTNCADSVNAVTWGVFGGKEIQQPTIVDEQSFKAWKDEAFSLWLQEWGHLYEENSVSRGVIQTIYDTWYLVNVVDNNFLAGNLFEKLRNFIPTDMLYTSPRNLK